MSLRNQLPVVCCVFAALWLSGSTLQAQRNLKNIPDPDPLLQLAELEVAPEFEISLYAADPRIAKPIQMNFDPAGRLWVASSEVYPQIEPGQKANDKILIIEDQDRDGVADTTTVFADGLLIPTGVEPGDDGVYVANSTELLHLKDTDGDGVADTERVMLSGFGTEDTHHILHTLRWGPEGLLYMNQSIYIHSHIETPYGVRRMNGGGVWHFRPETMQLEPYTYGLVNPWGHAFDKFGQSFETDGAGGEGINYVFPDFVGVTSPGAKRIFHGLNPGKPKLCGLEIIGGSHIPEEWRGDLITNDFRAHRVCRYKVQDDGAGYTSRELDELVRTRHQAFRPIDVKLGPDGAIYIADWYNPIIQHGEVDFRDPRRDHTHGRIWRIAAKDRPLLPPRNLYDTPTAELLRLLAGDEPYWRRQAKRVLKERGADDVLPVLAKLLPDTKGRTRLEMLWVYQSLDVVNNELLSELLKHDDAKIRAAACRVLYHWQDRVPNHMNWLEKLANDDHPQVRMEASHALRRSTAINAGLIAMQAAQKPTDRFLKYALEQTADQTSANWLPALRQGKLSFGDNAAGLLFALAAADSAEAVPILLASADSWSNDEGATRQVMNMVAARGNRDELSSVFDLAVAPDTKDRLRVSLLSALQNAASKRGLRPATDVSSVRELLTSSNADVRATAMQLAGSWHMRDLATSFEQVASDEDESRPIRLAAIQSLASMRQLDSLVHLAGQQQPIDLRLATVARMTGVDLKAASSAAIGLLPELDTSHDPTPLLRAFLSQDGGDAALTSALKASDATVNQDVAKLCVRVARTSGRDVGALIEQLNRIGNLAAQPEPLTDAERQQLLEQARTDGNPVRGESVYRRSELNCQKCHAIGGAGGSVGPDLASIGASAPADYILESMLEPNAKIKENYHSQIVATDEGEVLTGVLLRETDEALILRDAEDREISIPLDSIEERKDGGSLMPAGLMNDLTRQETLDLIRFLTELGKIGDFALSRQAYVRSWETLLPGANAGQLRRRGEPELAVDPRFKWTPLYAQVSGHLDPAEAAAFQPVNVTSPTRYFRFTLDYPTNSARSLQLNRTNGIRIYVDGKPVKPAAELQLELEQGQHTVMLAVEAADAKPIRVLVGTP